MDRQSQKSKDGGGEGALFLVKKNVEFGFGFRSEKTGKVPCLISAREFCLWVERDKSAIR